MIVRGQTDDVLEARVSKRGLTVKVAGRQVALSAIAALTLLGLFYLYVIF